MIGVSHLEQMVNGVGGVVAATEYGMYVADEEINGLVSPSADPRLAVAVGGVGELLSEIPVLSYLAREDVCRFPRPCKCCAGVGDPEVSASKLGVEWTVRLEVRGLERAVPRLERGDGASRASAATCEVGARSVVDRMAGRAGFDKALALSE